MAESKAVYKAGVGGIIRVRKDARYFSASNEPFNDQRLSWESRGLMGYLLSKPDGWEVRLQDILGKGPAGAFKVRRMMAELRMAGYMNRIRLTLPGNTFDWITEVFESPSLNPRENASSRFSTSGKSTSGKPRDVLSTESLSTDLDDEESLRNRTGVLTKLYQDNLTGMITGLTADLIRNASIDFKDESWYEPAFKIAVANGVRKWSYVDAILKSWHVNGFGWKPAKYGRKNGGGKTTKQKQLSPQELEEMREFAKNEFARKGLI